MNNPTFIPTAITYLHLYVHSSNEQVKSYLYHEVLPIYMSLSHDSLENLIGCFLIRILRGTSITHASPVHMHITTHITLSWLQLNHNLLQQLYMNMVYMKHLYETSPIIKKLN